MNSQTSPVPLDTAPHVPDESTACTAQQVPCQQRIPSYQYASSPGRMTAAVAAALCASTALPAGNWQRGGIDLNHPNDKRLSRQAKPAKKQKYEVQ